MSWQYLLAGNICRHPAGTCLKQTFQALSWYLLAGRAGADRACCLLARAAEIYLMDNAGEFTDVPKQEYKKVP